MYTTTGRKFLLTGASYGLGAAIATAIKAKGDSVYSVSRTPPDKENSTWIQGDLGAVSAIPEIVDRLATEATNPFDGIVFNAALADKTNSQWTVEQVERHFQINALSPFAMWYALVERGLIASPCNVVLMGSFLQNGNIRQPAYAMSKAALWSWMRSYTMAQRTEDPVSMNMIWPGRVETPANPRRELPPGDPNLFYSAGRVAEVVMSYLYQTVGGPRGTVVDLGRS